jgi:hypothetical protein
MSRLVCLVTAGALFVLSTAPASAQVPRPERPYRGLFGSGVGVADQSLLASGTLAAGWDDNLLAAARGGSITTGPAVGPSGSLATVKAGLSYRYHRQTISFGATGTTAYRYFPTLNDEFVRTSHASLSFSSAPRPTRLFTVTASAAHQPYSLGSLFPSELGIEQAASDIFDIDTYISSEPRLSYAGSFMASEQLSRRTFFGAGYTYRRTHKPGDTTDYVYQSAGARLSHVLATGLSTYGGYTFAVGQSVDTKRHAYHRIDAGVNYNRALSFTRRTTLTFSTGSAVTERDLEFQFHLTGNVALTHEMGRSWATWVSYGRHVVYHETWREPGLGNAVVFGVGGSLNRRVDFKATGRVAFGTVGVQTNAPEFDHYYGTATLSYAMNRFIQAHATYGYYQHRYDDAVPLAALVPRSLERNSVRVGINLKAPLFERSRRADATR